MDRTKNAGDNRISDSFYLGAFENAQRRIREAATDPAPLKERVVAALSRRDRDLGLSPGDVATLLGSLRHPDRGSVGPLIISEARQLRQRLFGDRVATMVPIEISSYCMSNCDFCGWRSSNKRMLRLKISQKALERQTEELARLGFSHFEIASGDDLNFIRDELFDCIQIVKGTARRFEPQARVSICLTPLHESHYHDLANQGLDTVLTWQETYQESNFNRYVTQGPKARGITADFKVDKAGSGFLARMKSQESAVRAGLQVGLGVMIGLADEPEADILAAVLHGQALIESYRETIQPLIIGMPTWNPITTSETDNLQVDRRPLRPEDCFELVAAIYLLSFSDHYAWVFPNCRVSKDTQIRSILTAGCFTSTMVRVGPGAYLDSLEGEDAKEAFSKSSTPIEELGRSDILMAEQFVHHYGSHQSYLDAFDRNGLKVVADEEFLLHEEAEAVQ